MGKTDGVRRRGKNTFQIRYYNADGIRQAETVKAKNATEAAGIRNARLADIAKGIPVTSKPNLIRFEELCADVVNHYIVNGLHSMTDIETRYRLHILPLLGKRKAASITTASLNAYILKRQESAPKPKAGTINRELEAIRRAFRLAFTDGKILAMPKIPMLRERNVRSGFFTREEVDRLCRYLKPPLDSFVKLAFLTAWRKDELRNLRWSNVDFAAGELRLDVGSTKSGRGRVFPMSAEIRTLLEALPRKGLYVFTVKDKPVLEFRKQWRSANFKAGLPCVLNTEGKPIKAIRVFHDLRRSCVKALIAKGIPERVIMAMCGWETRSVFDRYHVVGDEDLTIAVRLMDGDRNGDKSRSGKR